MIPLLSVISRSFQPDMATTKLQEYIASIGKWFMKWKVKINYTKCVVIYLTYRQRKITICNKTIQCKNHLT